MTRFYGADGLAAKTKAASSEETDAPAELTAWYSKYRRFPGVKESSATVIWCCNCSPCANVCTMFFEPVWVSFIYRTYSVTGAPLVWPQASISTVI